MKIIEKNELIDYIIDEMNKSSSHSVEETGNGYRISFGDKLFVHINDDLSDILYDDKVFTIEKLAALSKCNDKSSVPMFYIDGNDFAAEFNKDNSNSAQNVIISPILVATNYYDKYSKMFVDKESGISIQVVEESDDDTTSVMFIRIKYETYIIGYKYADDAYKIRFMTKNGFNMNAGEYVDLINSLCCSFTLNKSISAKIENNLTRCTEDKLSCKYTKKSRSYMCCTVCNDEFCKLRRGEK